MAVHNVRVTIDLEITDDADSRYRDGFINSVVGSQMMDMQKHLAKGIEKDIYAKLTYYAYSVKKGSPDEPCDS